MFRPLSEAFIRRSWYSVLPVVDTTGRRYLAVFGTLKLMIPTITLQFITEIRQATWLRGVENDASARQRNLSLASCDLDFDLL